MKVKNKYILVLVIINLFMSGVYAEDVTHFPLTLSDKQAAKLKQVFPSSVSENANENAVQHLVWRKVPLNITLPINKERLISFPDNVQFGYDTTALSSDTLTVQNNNGTLYLIAKSNFESQRVYIQLKQSGEIILLNLSAKADADDTPLSIELANADVQKTKQNEVEKEERVALSPVELTRYAVQQLYAPKRLVTAVPSVFRVPMHTTKTVPLVQGDSVIAMPLVTWRSKDQYITAVLLRNRLKNAITLDPRQMRGHWKTATFFPKTRLMPAGNPFDSTTVFLISDQSFAEALGV